MQNVTIELAELKLSVHGVEMHAWTSHITNTEGTLKIHGIDIKIGQSHICLFPFEMNEPE